MFDTQTVHFTGRRLLAEERRFTEEAVVILTLVSPV